MLVATTAQCPTRLAQITGEWIFGYLVKKNYKLLGDSGCVFSVIKHYIAQADITFDDKWAPFDLVCGQHVSQAETFLYLISGSLNQSWSIQFDSKHRH